MNRGKDGAGERQPILVIEDEPSVSAFLQAALERRGYTVVPSASGAEGIELLGKKAFRGVISDIRTPGGASGADVHDWIRRHRPELAGHLIFITGDMASKETLDLLRESGTPCVEKPFRVQQLLTAVERTLGEP